MGEIVFVLLLLGIVAIMFTLSIINAVQYVNKPTGQSITFAIVYMFVALVHVYSLFEWVPAK